MKIDVVWIAFVVLVVVMMITGDTSWHDWSIRFYFPKLGFWGVLFVTAYITAIIEAFRHSKVENEPLLSFIAFAAIYLFLILPGALFVGLLELGHNRLMEKREAEAANASDHY